MSVLAPTVIEKGAHLGRLREKVVLLLLVLVFAFGAITWVQFFRAPDTAGGNSARLFTQTDYVGIAIGAQLVHSGQGAALYDLSHQLQVQRELIKSGYLYQPSSSGLIYPYPYTPFLAVLLSPLAALSPLDSWAIWDILNLAGMATGLWCLVQALPLSRNMRLLHLLAGLTCTPFIVNLEQGQSSGIMMFSIGVGIALLKKEKDLPAGLVLGLLLLKVQWLPLLVVVLLFNHRWRAISAIAVTGIVLGTLTVLTAGVGWIPGFLNITQKAQQFAPELILNPWFSHSLSGQINFILPTGMSYDQKAEVIKYAMYVALALAAILLIAIWRKVSWKSGTPTWDGAMSVTLLVTTLTVSQLNTHDLCLLAASAALGTSYLVGSRYSDKAVGAWFVLCLALYMASAFLISLDFDLPVRGITVAILCMVALLSALLLRKYHPSPASLRPLVGC